MASKRAPKSPSARDSRKGARPSTKPPQFKDAVDFFRRKVPMTDAQFDRMAKRSRDRAFTVADVTNLQVLNDVWKSLDRAIDRGTDFGTWKEAVGPALREAWAGDKPGRLENIFRTNVQSAYNAGRWFEMNEPDTLEIRPYFRYAALLDPRTSRICRPLDGIVLPASSVFWQNHVPPLHYQCRSTIISLTDEQAAEAGGVKKKAPDVAPLDGFGKAPDKETWKPDLSGIAPELVKASKSRKR